jgi:MoxR-like ATPase
VLEARSYVIPDDVKRAAVPVLAHRLTLTVQAWTTGVQPEDVVREVVNGVAGPPAVGRPVATDAGVAAEPAR